MRKVVKAKQLAAFKNARGVLVKFRIPVAVAAGCLADDKIRIHGRRIDTVLPAGNVNTVELHVAHCGDCRAEEAWTACLPPVRSLPSTISSVMTAGVSGAAGSAVGAEGAVLSDGVLSGVEDGSSGMEDTSCEGLPVCGMEEVCVSSIG